MIEFSQPAQCLFCPQRRKIALLLKLVMAASAAIITAIILFQPGTRRPSAAPSAQNAGVPSRSVQVTAEGPTARRLVASEAVSKRSAQIRAEAQEHFQAVQAQIRPLLSEGTAPVTRAQDLLEGRRKEVLRTKVLILGEGLFSESGAAEAERKLVLEALDKELSVLAEQKDLLAELKESDSTPRR